MPKVTVNRIKKKPKVGVVGEILVKFHPDANNNIIKVIEKERRRSGNARTFGFYALLLL